MRIYFAIEKYRTEKKMNGHAQRVFDYLIDQAKKLLNVMQLIES